MKSMLVTLALAFATTAALADQHQPAAAKSANAGCEAQAAEKKLAGAAKGSFMKKCEREANAAKAAAACGEKAAEKKLAGAAKNSFMKKCEKDAVAAK